MRNIFNKISILSVAMILLMAISSCEKNNNTIDPEPDPKPEYKSLFSDKKYENGFSVGFTDESNGQERGLLDYDGKATGTPV